MDKYEGTRNWTPEQRRAAFRAAREAEARNRKAEMQQCEWREAGSPCPVHDDPDEPHNCGACRSCTLRVCVRCERREALPYPEGCHCGQYCRQCEADSASEHEAWERRMRDRAASGFGGSINRERGF